METPITRLLKSFQKAIDSMPRTPDNIVRETTTECMKLAEAFLHYEELAIKQAFTDGEQNVWDRDINEHQFEYSGREDYFNKNYKK